MPWFNLSQQLSTGQLLSQPMSLLPPQWDVEKNGKKIRNLWVEIKTV